MTATLLNFSDHPRAPAAPPPTVKVIAIQPPNPDIYARAIDTIRNLYQGACAGSEFYRFALEVMATSQGEPRIARLAGELLGHLNMPVEPPCDVQMGDEA